MGLLSVLEYLPVCPSSHVALPAGAIQMLFLLHSADGTAAGGGSSATAGEQLGVLTLPQFRSTMAAAKVLTPRFTAEKVRPHEVRLDEAAQALRLEVQVPQPHVVRGKHLGAIAPSEGGRAGPALPPAGGGACAPVSDPHAACCNLHTGGQCRIGRYLAHTDRQAPPVCSRLWPLVVVVVWQVRGKART